MYCCFIDFKKAFDTVNRAKLWRKLNAVGISGKMICIIRSMYEKMKTCVQSAGMLSEFFMSNVGFLQGEVLSPMLFSLYVNDFEAEFLKNDTLSLNLRDLNLFVLMYADDMVIFSESVDELQKMLDTLHVYSTDWDLTVKVEKTKVVIFRNGGKIKSNEKWNLNGHPLEIVDKFVYLGVLLNFNGKYQCTQKQLAIQARKAMFALKSNVRNMCLNVETLISLFDTYVASILNYGCEVWGSHSANDVEKVHLEYIKSILGVRKNTNTASVYFETGRLPMKTVRFFRMFKFWFKVLCSENCIIKNCYGELYNNCERMNKSNRNWACCIKDKLFEIGLGYVWDEQNKTNCPEFFPLIKQRLIDISVQSCQEQINNSSKCVIYKHVIDHFCLQYYLCKAIPPIYKKCISQIRLSSHNLEIETGRHNNVLLNNRICKLCKRDLEDEFHFVLVCPHFEVIHKKFIKKYYWKKPSIKCSQYL